MSNRPNDEHHDVTVFPSAPAGAGESALQAGTTVHEFRILNLIGEGGFGIVYLAHDDSLERTVALKEYMPSQLAERTGGTASVQVRSERYADTFDAGMRSFINEAKLLARFDHPSLLKVYRFFQANGTAYMAMPFYEGQTLKAVLRGLSGPPDERWLRRILYQLLDGLEVIHAYDCYHRDIAPDNILLQQDTPILLDFGAARRVIGDMTQNLTVILKPGYAPIEQYADDPGMKQGAWTDIYALAGVVHFALTQKAPPPAVGRAMNDQFVPLAERMRGVYSDGFLKTIDKALSVKPQDRPQSAAALRALLLASDEGGAAVHAPAAPVMSIKSLAAADTTSGIESTAPPVRSVRTRVAADEPSQRTDMRAPGGSPWRSAIVPLALAVPAAAAALWWVMRPTPEPQPTEARAPTAPAAEIAPAAPQRAPVAVAPAPPPPPVAVAPAPIAPAPKPQAPPPAPTKPVAVAPAKAPEATKAPAVPAAKAPEPSKAVPVAPAKAPEPPKVAAAPAVKPEPAAPRPAPRAEEEAPPPAKSPPQQVARVEPKPEPPPQPRAEAPKPPVEVARVEPKAAQTAALIGRYTGRLVSQGTPVGITLVIQSVQDGSVSGIASQSVGPCQGDYRMTGTVRDDSLRMRSTHAGGRYGDCSFGFRASVQGTKLVGETGNGTPLELAR